MSRRYGRVRCPVCHTWYGLDEQHQCPTNAAVMSAAFGGPGRIGGSNDRPCQNPTCGCRIRMTGSELVERAHRLDAARRVL